MARSARLVVLLAVLAVLAGCTGPGLDKAGGSQRMSLGRCRLLTRSAPTSQDDSH